MTGGRGRLFDVLRPVLSAVSVSLAGLFWLTGAATATSSTSKVVRYDGVRVSVPRGWPVFRLRLGSSVCVRFNRHAVYLGTPSGHENCPLHTLGRTEAILISPRPSASGLAGVSVPGAAPAGGSMVRVVEPRRDAVIIATWNHNPGLIKRALDMRSLRAAISATDHQMPKPARAAILRSRVMPRVASGPTPATPGQVYSGRGFDACTAPSASSMSAWTGTSPFAAVGVYIGGTNAACVRGNLTPGWVSAESAAGWHLIPTYVGLQAPGNSCGCAAITPAQAANQGVAAAQDAVAQSQALGIGPGNPIYLDMENYARGSTASSAVLAFLQAWTQQLHATGYLSGVYGSGSSAITDLVSQAGGSYVEPDDIWVAHWSTSSQYVPTSVADSYVPATDWPNNQRLIQYYGGHSVTYNGVTLSIDSDYLDGATAAAGSGSFVSLVAAAPSLTVRPQPDGSVALTPAWAGELSVSSFAILGGESPATMTTIMTVPSSHSGAVTVRDLYPYFGVAGLSSSGQILGSSLPVATPARPVIFGNSAFVGVGGPVGVPIACANALPCQIQAGIYEGHRLLAQVASQTLPGHGTLVLFPLSTRVRRLVARAARRRLPVMVRVIAGTGAQAARSLNLIPFTASGAAPARRAWAGDSLEILGGTQFVLGGRTGAVLAACTAATPCVTTTSVTRGGAPIATAATQTLGAGEVGYLRFALNPRGRALLAASRGNQFGARVTVTTASASAAGGAAAAAAFGSATALVSLDSYR